MDKDYQLQMSLEGKIALVTGAGRGLGKWIAKGLSLSGADVAVAALHLDGVRQTAREIEEMKGNAYPVAVDLREIDSIESMVRQIVSQFGRIDILVNNAGVSIHKSFIDVTPEDFDHIADVNFKAVYFVSQFVAKEMISNGGGKIINISSAAGFLVRAGIPYSVYAGTKAAVIMLTKALAEELAPHNINVNAVAPGYFETEMVKDRIEDKAVLERILSFTPLKRLGGRSDIINPVVFLASDASNFITGQTLFVDGGRTVL